MPDAELGYYTDWWNGGTGGPPMWETFHLDELRPILERFDLTHPDALLEAL